MIYTCPDFGRGWLYQIRSGTSKLDYINSFGDDPKDQYDIDKGYKYYEQKRRSKKAIKEK